MSDPFAEFYQTSRAEVDGHKNAIARFAYEYQLNASRYVFIGTGGLAMLGYAAHVPSLSPQRFDGDVLDAQRLPLQPEPLEDITLSEAELIRRRLTQRGERGGEIKWLATPSVIGGCVLSKDMTHLVATKMGFETRGELLDARLKVDHTISVEGKEVAQSIAVIPPLAAFNRKLQRGLSKDVVGLVKAHLLATYEEKPITEDSTWRKMVTIAVKRMHVEAEWSWNGTDWIRRLLAMNFNHPAFKGLR